MKLIVFDGNSIINRAFYGIRALTTKDGLPTNAVYGFINIILKNLKLAGDDTVYGAVAFDMRAPTFRHKMYEGYKATRKGMPDELAVQLPYAKKAASLLGFGVLEKEGYEADDIIGTLARVSAENGVECIIVTGDRDSLQLINDSTKVFLAATNETKIFDRSAFFETYGIQPESFVDVKAIMGDTSDNIPGVAGIGEKGALKLIAEHSDLDGVYSALDTFSAKQREKLEAGKESAYMSKRLAQIDAFVPIDNKIETYRFAERSNNALLDFFETLEFRNLGERLGIQKTVETVDCFFGDDIKGDFANADEVFAMCSEGLLYVSDCVSLYKKYDLASLRITDIIDKKITVWNKKEFAHETGIYLENGDDVSLLGYAACQFEGGGVSLPKLAERYLGVSTDGTPESLLAHIGALRSKMKDEADKNGQTELYVLELRLSKVLYEMELEGFGVDADALRGFSEQLNERIEESEQQIYFYSGMHFNINSTKQLGTVLYDVLQLPHPKKNKTGYSTDAETLEKLRGMHPIIDEILIYRQLFKLKTTYADGLLKAISDVDGRIHTTFKQTLTQTGRLSSVEPNLQNIPVRTELGKVLRKFFSAKDGYVLVDADYSQIELRILAHISNDETLINAFKNGEDIHTLTASQVFNVPFDCVTSDMRKSAKAVNFGIVYGISEFSLAADIGVSRYEAKAYIDGYFSKYPRVKEYMDRIISEAKENGYVTTLFGRRRYIPDIRSAKHPLRTAGERIARNSPIQGTAADIIKKAMVDVMQAVKEGGYHAQLILQIHDELIVECREDEAEAVKELLVSKMENAFELSVPLTVDAGIGKTWYDAHS